MSADISADAAARLQRILASPAYRLAWEDAELLQEPALRPLRLQLELLKPEQHLRAMGIDSTVVVFGSARTPDMASATRQRDALLARRGDGGAGRKRDLMRAERGVRQARHYEDARRFAQLVTRRFQREERRDFVVVTGGGPGIMEAANRGAHEAGGRSIGLNITLPNEQEPNAWITPELAFRFHYFALRKMHFLLRARGLVAFPGGYGTLDELFEVLTLIQTRKMAPIPVVLVGSAFWRRVIDFPWLVAEGYIDPADVALVQMVDTPEAAIAVLERFHREPPPQRPPAC